jgi:hypothetical protein
MSAFPRKSPQRKYRVLYAVTREEYYEVEAASADEAVDTAFQDGELVESGDTTNVVDCDVQKVSDQAGAP